MKELAAAEAIFAINDLTEENYSYREKYPFLDSDLPVEEWWGNLSFDEKLKVGGIAIHFHYMTANCKWNCYDGFSEVRKSQQKRIKKVYNRKDDKYFAFDPFGLFGVPK